MRSYGRELKMLFRGPSPLPFREQGPASNMGGRRKVTLEPLSVLRCAGMHKLGLVVVLEISLRSL
jgi:hypothetical protein